jgi:hypothetical protein
MRGYRELLRQYGLIPAANDVADPATVGAPLCAAPGPVRQIVDLPGYATWEEVLGRSDEFIRALYSQERIEVILGARGKRAVQERFGV